VKGGGEENTIEKGGEKITKKNCGAQKRTKRGRGSRGKKNVPESPPNPKTAQGEGQQKNWALWVRKKRGGGRDEDHISPRKSRFEGQNTARTPEGKRKKKGCGLLCKLQPREKTRGYRNGFLRHSLGYGQDAVKKKGPAELPTGGKKRSSYREKMDSRKRTRNSKKPKHRAKGPWGRKRGGKRPQVLRTGD